MTTQAFCTEHGISTSTLGKWIKSGPQQVKEPVAIQYFKLYTIEGKTTTEIADLFNVTNHAVFQSIHATKKKVTKYIADNDVMSVDGLELERFSVI